MFFNSNKVVHYYIVLKSEIDLMSVYLFV